MNETNVLTLLIETLSQYKVEIIATVAVLVALWLIGVPILKRLLWRRRNAKEVASFKDDLLIGAKIEGLARGGDAAAQAKARAANKNAMVRSLFERSVTILRDNAHLPKSIPWFIILGEPDSGKSKLLEKSELELTPTADEVVQTLDNGERRRESLPVRFWLGARAVVVDVSGRVFFDRWLESSSAEFTTLVKLIARYHRAKPLSGVILVIPADALLLDDESLKRRKAQLAASELERLTAGVAMHLPCHVVVTKLDLLEGFRETFEELDETMRRKAFVWEPALTQRGSRAVFDEVGFECFWQQTVRRLRSSRNALMLSRSLFDTAVTEMDRGNVASALYLFPERFDALRTSLENYLKTLFGSSDQFGVRRLHLASVSLTSSMDEGVRIDPRFSALAGQSGALNPVREVRPWGDRAYFVRDLLSLRIFGRPETARFTRSEIVRRHIPHYACIAVLLGCAALWIWSGFMDQSRVRAELVGDTALLERISSLFDTQTFRGASLIFTDNDGKVCDAFDEPMPGLVEYTRIDFFLRAREELYSRRLVPLGMRAPELIQYRLSPDYGKDDKHYIFNRIQTEMAWLPALRAAARKFEFEKGEPLNENKRNAIAQYLSVGLYRQSSTGTKSRSYNANYEADTMDSILVYLFPNMQQETRRILGTFDPDNDRDADVLNAEIVTSPLYQSGLWAGVESVATSWSTLSAYPESTWGRMRGALMSGSDLLQNIEKASSFVEKTTSVAAYVEALSHSWQEYVSHMRRTYEAIEPAQMQLLRRFVVLGEQSAAMAKGASGGAEQGAALPEHSAAFSAAVHDFFTKAADDYGKRLNADFLLIANFEKNWQGGMPDSDSSGSGLLTQAQIEAYHDEAAARFTDERRDLETKLAEILASG